MWNLENNKGHENKRMATRDVEVEKESWRKDRREYEDKCKQVHYNNV